MVLKDHRFEEIHAGQSRADAWARASTLISCGASLGPSTGADEHGERRPEFHCQTADSHPPVIVRFTTFTRIVDLMSASDLWPLLRTSVLPLYTPSAPHPAVAVQQCLTVAADRVMRRYRARTDRAHNLGARDMLDAAIIPKHDILGWLHRHATDGTSGEFGSRRNRWSRRRLFAPSLSDYAVIVTDRAARLSTEDASVQDQLSDRFQGPRSIYLQVRRRAVLTDCALRKGPEERQQGLGSLGQHLVERFKRSTGRALDVPREAVFIESDNLARVNPSAAFAAARKLRGRFLLHRAHCRILA